jgi:hypothetical protein
MKNDKKLGYSVRIPLIESDDVEIRGNELRVNNTVFVIQDDARVEFCNPGIQIVVPDDSELGVGGEK